MLLFSMWKTMRPPKPSEVKVLLVALQFAMGELTEMVLKEDTQGTKATIDTKRRVGGR